MGSWEKIKNGIAQAGEESLVKRKLIDPKKNRITNTRLKDLGKSINFLEEISTKLFD